MMDKCCLNCKHCIVDMSVDDIECGLPFDNSVKTEWVNQKSEDYYAPDYDYCTEWEEYIPVDGILLIHPKNNSATSEIHLQMRKFVKIEHLEIFYVLEIFPKI